MLISNISTNNKYLKEKVRRFGYEINLPTSAEAFEL